MAEKQFVAAAQVDEVPAGAKKVVEINGTEVILCNTKDKIFAVKNLCSHAYEKLEDGRLRNGWISCPVHGARFNLETGDPMNPPATIPVEVYEVEIDGETIKVAV